MKWAIFDLDGVLSDCARRVPLALEAKSMAQGPLRDAAWDRFHAEAYMDRPHEGELAIALAWLKAGHQIVYLTGRPERFRAPTRGWLQDRGLTRSPLFMRPDNDHRPALDFKRAALPVILDLIKPFDGRIDFIMEDQQEIVDMWRGNGFTCLQPRSWTLSTTV